MKRNNFKPIFIVCYLLVAFSSCNNDPKTETDKLTEAPPIVANQPKDIPYQIVNEFPHDTACFTEGLQYVDGKMYESAGLNGKSDIRITDLATGKILLQHKLDKKYFGEGIVVIKDKAYQLTYQENTGFIYDAKTLKLLKMFTYNFGEGWGMTTDGKSLIISNGSSTIFFLDPETLKQTRTIDVNNMFGSLSDINELEYIKGFIYADVWQQDIIIKIDPANGKIVGKVDLSNLRNKYKFTPLADVLKGGSSGADVLNGIAYDSTNNRIFITGKLWPKVFEVKLDN